MNNYANILSYSIGIIWCIAGLCFEDKESFKAAYCGATMVLTSMLLAEVLNSILGSVRPRN
jgi:hypothetical protein